MCGFRSDKIEQRRNWRINWLSCIHEFADYATQRRMWLDAKNTNPHYAFVKYMCCYFDDLNLPSHGYQSALSEGLVSPNEVAATSIFYQMVDDYKAPANEYDRDAIVADAKWSEVVRSAQQAQAALLCLISESFERRRLTEAYSDSDQA